MPGVDGRSAACRDTPGAGIGCPHHGCAEGREGPSAAVNRPIPARLAYQTVEKATDAAKAVIATGFLSKDEDRALMKRARAAATGSAYPDRRRGCTPELRLTKTRWRGRPR